METTNLSHSTLFWVWFVRAAACLFIAWFSSWKWWGIDLHGVSLFFAISAVACFLMMGWHKGFPDSAK